MRDPGTVTLAKSRIVVTCDDDFSTADVLAAQRAIASDGAALTG